MNQLQALFSPLFVVNQKLGALLNTLQPLALLAARLYVAWVFFASGLIKIDNWETTLFLFELEYAVPFFSPVVAVRHYF